MHDSAFASLKSHWGSKSKWSSIRSKFIKSQKKCRSSVKRKVKSKDSEKSLRCHWFPQLLLNANDILAYSSSECLPLFQGYV